MKKNKWIVLTTILVLLAAVSGCSDDDGDKNIITPGEEDDVVSVENDDGSWTSRLNATDYDSYTYLNLQTQTQVEIGDAQAENDSVWHVAFSRINGKLNSGASGPGGLFGLDLEELAGTQGLGFEAITEVPVEAEGQWQSDTPHLVIDDLFYTYNPVNHQVNMTGNIFVLYTVDGKYAKFTVSAMEGAGMPPNLGTITLTYVYQANGSTDLSAEPQTLTVDGTDGIAYVSFVQGGEVQVSDPMNSTAWDICFFYNQGLDDGPGDDRYSIKTNSGISGSQSVGVYPMYLEEDDFAAVQTAPVGGGYFTDSMASIFGSPTAPGSEWYEYDMNSGRHEIISREHVYLVMIDEATVFKLMVTNYYHPETGQSGYITLRYKQL